MRRSERLAAYLLHALLFKKVATGWKWPSCDDTEASWEPVRFPGWLGGEFGGLFGRAKGEARGVVVCAHPTTRAAKGYFLEIGTGRALREAGFHVLLFDFNGFGESSSMGFYYHKDILAAGEAAQRLTPGLPVGLLGVCFGGVYGACALAEQGHPFSAAVLEAPYGSVSEILHAMSQRARRPRMMRFRAYVLGTLALFRPSMNPLRQTRRIQGVRDVLFVSGEADTYVTPASVQRFADALAHAPDAPRSAHWVVPRAEHLLCPAPDLDGYVRRIAGFFNAAWPLAEASEASMTEAARPRLAA